MLRAENRRYAKLEFDLVKIIGTFYGLPTEEVFVPPPIGHAWIRRMLLQHTARANHAEAASRGDV